MARSESTVRVNVAPKAVFQMWSDISRLGDFLPAVAGVEATEAGFRVKLSVGDQVEQTEVALTAIEKPRRLVWRSFRGARWNGELILRPTVDGTEIRYIVDYEPSSLRQNPTERSVVVPTWNVGGDLLAFKNYAEKSRAGDREAEPVGA